MQSRNAAGDRSQAAVQPGTPEAPVSHGCGHVDVDHLASRVVVEARERFNIDAHDCAKRLISRRPCADRRTSLQRIGVSMSIPANNIGSEAFAAFHFFSRANTQRSHG